MASKDDEKERPSPFKMPIMPDAGSIDLRKIYKVQNTEPDFIPYNTRGRDIWGRLCFYTGIAWSMGFSAGGVLGVREGLVNAANSSVRIKMNGIMNGVSKHGSTYGSALGVIGIYMIFLLTHKKFKFVFHSSIYTHSFHLGRR